MEIPKSLSDRKARQAFKEATPDPTYDTALDLMEQYVFLTARDTRERYVYDDELGIYRLEAGIIAQYAQASLASKATKHVVKEIEGHIERSTLTDREQFCGVFDSNLLHVKNGWLDLDMLTLEPHTKKRFSTAKLPTAYEKNAGPVEFIQIVNAALSPEYHQVLFKVMGNILVKDTRFEKATMFIGDGHNRKGTIIKANINTIGRENCCHVSPQELADDKFASAQFYNKMLNAVADLKADKINNTGRFKELVSGDVIEAQRKHAHRFSMENHAKMIFSANDIPASSDQTNAYFRRWCIIPFYKTFERDPTIQERLDTDSERSGILNLMIYGRKLLMAKGFDDIPLEKVRRMYNRNASLAKDFVEQECILDLNNEGVDNRTLTTDIQDAYLEFDERTKGRKFEASEKDFLRRQLGQELEKLGVERKDLRDKRTGTRPYYYLGIVLKSQARQGSADVTAF
jgi:P4 family phage/plasmid primase-like protien